MITKMKLIWQWRMQLLNGSCNRFHFKRLSNPVPLSTQESKLVPENCQRRPDKSWGGGRGLGKLRAMALHLISINNSWSLCARETGLGIHHSYTITCNLNQLSNFSKMPRDPFLQITNNFVPKVNCITKGYFLSQPSVDLFVFLLLQLFLVISKYCPVAPSEIFCSHSNHLSGHPYD